MTLGLDERERLTDTSERLDQSLYQQTDGQTVSCYNRFFVYKMPLLMKINFENIYYCMPLIKMIASRYKETTGNSSSNRDNESFNQP